MNQPVIVILAGGRGKRFWPLSRKKYPKQLLSLIGGQSLLQACVERVRGLVDDTRLFVVANQDYSCAIQEQLPMLLPENLIIEPESCNTAPAIGLTTLWLKKRFSEDPVVIFLPSDLYIDQTDAYRRFLGAVIDYCISSGNPVIGGTMPTRPETGFGYIHAGKNLGVIQGFDYRQIIRFKEKPDLKLAEEYLEAGTYLWNAGVFAWRLSTLMDKFQTHLPSILERLQQYLAELSGNNLSKAELLYRGLPSVSFDEGILEPSAGGLVAFIGDYTWSDLGSWNAWTQFWPDDGDGNRVQGRHFGVDTEGCIIYSPDKPVATLGLTNLVIVETEDILMVCDRNQVQDIKKLVCKLKELGMVDIL